MKCLCFFFAVISVCSATVSDLMQPVARISSLDDKGCSLEWNEDSTTTAVCLSVCLTLWLLQCALVPQCALA